MFWYPFDTQMCPIDYYLPVSSAVLLPYNMSYIGPKELAEYYVHNIETCLSVIKGKSGVKVNIILGRRIMSNVLTVFLPTIILIIISHSANHFQENNIDIVISVDLTVLLVLATL